MRRKTVSVNVGIVDIGSNHSIKTQSMTTASTLDTNASVEEAIRIIDAGGKLVRFTAPNTKEAENLENIKSAIRKKGYETPFVADIHFVPKAALVAAQIVEKVRINPGNYVDTKRFKIVEYDDATYNKEVKRTITGKVVSNSMDKSITVAIERKLKHPLYNKYIFKTSKIMAHDENGDSKVGDIVAIEETRPISKNKSWTLNKIIKESQQES